MSKFVTLHGFGGSGGSDPVLQDKNVTPLTSPQSIVADEGFDGLGVVSVEAMPVAEQAVPSISVNSAGKITASTTQAEGYVTAGTKSATKQLTTKAAATITPGTSNKTIAAGTYLTGTQTIAGDADLKAANIIKGVNIFGVDGSYSGVELNFDVVAYNSEEALLAAIPPENTIGVVTTTAITGWAFSTTQPTNPKEGMVWIFTGPLSTVEFNALKQNTVQVCPDSIMQYISGSWASKTAKTYQNGKWIDWWDNELYKNGNEYEPITGGWVATDKSSSSDYETGTAPTIVRNAENIEISLSNSSTCRRAGAIHMNKDIDFTKYTTLVVEFAVIEVTGSFIYNMSRPTSVRVAVANRNNNYWYTDAAAYGVVKEFNSIQQFTNVKYELDVSTVNESLDIYIGLRSFTQGNSNTTTAIINKIYLE